VVLAVAFWPGRKEPEYQGKKLSEWLEAYRSANVTKATGAAQEQAADAVRHIGTNALPFLIEWIGYQPTAWRIKFTGALTRLPGPLKRARPARLLRVPVARAKEAICGFTILEKQAAPAVPALTELLQDWKSEDRASHVIVALGCVGERGLPPLVAALTNSAAPMWYRSKAASELADPVEMVGTNMSWAVRVLVPCLQDRAVGSLVARVLGRWKLAPEEAVPALAKCLRSSQFATRAEALTALGKFGAEASSAVPDLLIAAKDGDQLIRSVATNSLLKIAPEVLVKGEH